MAEAESELTKFLREQPDQPAEPTEAEKTAQRDQWMNWLGALYERIEAWLEPAKTRGIAQIEYQNTLLNEPVIGRYSVDSLILRTKGTKVTFRPYGTIIIGAHGRVDVLCGTRTARLVCGPEGQWFIASPGQGTAGLTPLDEDTFTQLLKLLMA